MPVNPSIQAYVDSVNSQFTTIEKAVDGVSADVDFLKARIEELQNNPGPISAEDQAVLDQAQARVNALATRITALDAATEPPTPPPTP